MIALLRRRREAAAEWNTAATGAQPGEIWTASYVTKRGVVGGFFASYTAGPVRILAGECPVAEFRGQKVLGEHDLDLPLTPGWLSHPADRYALHPMDGAPVVSPGTGVDLLAVSDGVQVTVEHRNSHPVYSGLRFVEIGLAGDVEDFDDGVGPGRYVGDSWVRLADVTGVES